jgi:nicotinic acid mononucleotide adenylyltransferase
MALAEAALAVVDEVLLVLPRVLPHKSFEGASFDERLGMLLAAAGGHPRYSIAASECGLFIDIAGECREVYGDSVRLMFLCGSDAAERIIHWDYGAPGAFLRMLEQFELLVAQRHGEFKPPPEMRHRIHALELPEDVASISATAVRERIRRGEPWEQMVPAGIVPMVRQVYGG